MVFLSQFNIRNHFLLLFYLNSDFMSNHILPFSSVEVAIIHMDSQKSLWANFNFLLTLLRLWTCIPMQTRNHRHAALSESHAEEGFLCHVCLRGTWGCYKKKWMREPMLGSPLLLPQSSPGVAPLNGWASGLGWNSNMLERQLGQYSDSSLLTSCIDSTSRNRQKATGSPVAQLLWFTEIGSYLTIIVLG